MTYQEYIQKVEAAWLTAQQQGNAEESQVLTAMLYRLVQPTETAVAYLTELIEKTLDPAVRSRYEQAVAQIRQCDAPVASVLPTRKELTALQFEQVLLVLRQS